VDELRAGSPEFDRWWRSQAVVERNHGHKRLRHPVGGEFCVRYDVLATLDHSDQRLFVLTPSDEVAEEALRAIIGRRGLQLARPTTAPA
jgi:hypothetical protein